MAESSVTEQTSTLRNAIVISHFGHEVLIRDENGEDFRAVTRSQLPGLVSGDRVHWQMSIDDTAVIETLAPRHGVLARSTKNNPDKIVVSNVDKVLIVCAIKPMFKTGLIDRYLVACELADITPVIVVNKADLLGEDKYDKVVNTLAMYEQIGYDIYYISTKEHSNIGQLRSSLLNSTAVLVGQSGVGKSSIIRALVPNAAPTIADISDATNKGKHTTSNSTLYDIDHNTHIIDSPGIREFGLKPLSADDLSHGFREFRAFIGQCKFRDCTHHQEPGCAIAQAVKKNEISQKRWDSYQAIAASFSGAT